ncbi:hypothetical protein [Luteibacter sp.]|uniref:hypothetical protein n=1 Tax=Luteibacter sp. TaxID=1886636 RepID=UPI0025C14443|nr:hypothetical protein [Luteibacter sp.]
MSKIAFPVEVHHSVPVQSDSSVPLMAAGLRENRSHAQTIRQCIGSDDFQAKRASRFSKACVMFGAIAFGVVRFSASINRANSMIHAAFSWPSSRGSLFLITSRS